MKKNLRIVSAAAAALLAVAPVAATAVVSAPTSTVQAASEAVGKDGYFDGDVVRTSVANTATADEVDATVNANASSIATKKVQSALSNSVAKVDVQSTTTKKMDASVDYPNGYFRTQIKFYINMGKDAKNLPAGLTKAGFTAVDANGNVVNGNKKTQTFSVLVITPINSDVEDSNSYFSTYEGNQLANDATVYAPMSETPKGNVTIAQLKNAIYHTVSFHDGKTNNVYSKADWDKYIFGPNATDDANIISQLRNNGVAVSGSGDTATYNADAAGQYTIIVRSNGGKRVHVVFYNTDAVNADHPAFQVRSDYRRTAGATTDKLDLQYGAWSAPFNQNSVVPTINLVQRDNGTFNPLDYIQAINTISLKGKISYTVKSNNVDWTKPGLYSVEVAATYKNKTTDMTIPVVVSAENGKMMTAIKDTNYYRLDNSNNLQQINLVNNQVHTGQAVRVFGQPVTHKLNGQDVQVYRVASPTSNVWVLASDLKDGVVNTPAAQETTRTVKIMHIATIYDKNGKATHEPALRAYNTVSVVSEPVSLKDEKGNDAGKFYKLAGKDQYIKVGNVDGTSRSLKHNSYVYKSTGKRANKKTLKKGSSVTTYGKSFMIAGHQMYRIGENQYVKKANF